ncbi:hypothetical protein DL95DRAFT_138461 [Leptodontidium sp. 2 PMI_412]|nr:hypothetical protein DL95DRAFT_138461 [Leptodontidium sp. 2 PMI_412]
MLIIRHFMCEMGSQAMPSPSQIIIVTPESAVSKTFRTFLDRLQGLHQLDRFVFDKCHTVLDSTPCWNKGWLSWRRL